MDSIVMLSAKDEKLIRSLHTKKGRDKCGLCLVEGEKNIKTAGNAVSMVFTENDTPNFNKLVTTETPQKVAAIAKTPTWTLGDMEKSGTIIALDGVQDPGNVGTILRLCLGFNATLILIESADPTNPKVIRSSAGAMFCVPWIRISRHDATQYLKNLQRPIYRLENKSRSIAYTSSIGLPDNIVLIAGSEGKGISIKLPGDSIKIKHDKRLESLNVATAIAIILNSRYTQTN